MPRTRPTTEAAELYKKLAAEHAHRPARYSTLCIILTALALLLVFAMFLIGQCTSEFCNITNNSKRVTNRLQQQSRKKVQVESF